MSRRMAWSHTVSVPTRLFSFSRLGSRVAASPNHENLRASSVPMLPTVHVPVVTAVLSCRSVCCSFAIFFTELGMAIAQRTADCRWLVRGLTPFHEAEKRSAENPSFVTRVVATHFMHSPMYEEWNLRIADVLSDSFWRSQSCTLHEMDETCFLFSSRVNAFLILSSWARRMARVP